MQLHDVHQGITPPQEAKADRPRNRLRARQDLEQGAQGPLLAPGVQAQPDLRGGPDAAGPPRPQARVRQRRVQEELRHRQPRRPRGNGSRPARSSTKRPCARKGWSRATRSTASRSWATARCPSRWKCTPPSSAPRPPSKIAAAGGKTVVVPYRPHAVLRSSGENARALPAIEPLRSDWRARGRPILCERRGIARRDRGRAGHANRARGRVAGAMRRSRGGFRPWISCSRSSRCPSCRRKILFTCLLPGHLPDRLLRAAADRQPGAVEELGGADRAVNTAGKLFGTVAMFGGTSIGMSTIFGLGIMPYISASIIFQLLASVVPSLEAMMKEGESGRKRINEYTRYATVVLCAIQSAFWVQYMMSPQMNVVLPRLPRLLARLGLRLHHDGRHDLPDVDRRADRRVRDRQRDQPLDHGGHPGAAGCRSPIERPLGQLDLEAERPSRASTASSRSCS